MSLKSYYKKDIFILVITLIVGAILRFVNIDSFRSLYADEGMYSQAAWLISIGRIPYKDFFLAQPPFWFFLTSIFINLLGSSIFSIRIVSVISSTLLIGLIYFLCRNIFGKIESIAASVIYAIHPYIVFWGKIGILEPLASLFLFTGVMIFLSNVNFSSRKMLLSGALIGVAFLTKYSILFFIVGAFPILLYSVLRKVSMIELLKCIGCIALGMVIVIIPFICYLCYVNAYYEFYLDTYVAQRLMFRFPEWVSLGFWGEFFVNLKFEIFLLIVYPLVFILARKIGFRSICISQLDEIALFSGVVTAFVLSFYLLRCFYSYTLSVIFPFIAFFSGITIYRVYKIMSKALLLIKKIGIKCKLEYIKSASLTLILVMYIGVNAIPDGVATIKTSYGNIISDRRVWTAFFAEEVGQYIKNITEQYDTIFTSQGWIGYLSGREITAVKERWKHQGFDEDAFGYGFREYRGGLILYNMSDFLREFERNPPKVYIFCSLGDYTPQDDMLWAGFMLPEEHGGYQEGLADFISTHYTLKKIIADDVPMDAKDPNAWVAIFEYSGHKEQVRETLFGTNQSAELCDSSWCVWTRGDGEGIIKTIDSQIILSYKTSRDITSDVRAEYRFEPMDFSSYEYLSIEIKGDGTENSLAITLMDSDNNTVGVNFHGAYRLDYKGWRKIIVPMPFFTETSFTPQKIDLKHIKQISLIIVNWKYDVSVGELCIRDICLLK